MMRTLATMLFELGKICAISAFIATVSAVLREALEEEQPALPTRSAAPTVREALWGDARRAEALTSYIVPSRHPLP